MTLNPADTAFAERLRTLLPDDRIRAVEPRYLEEPRGRYAGRAGVLALPRSTDEVALLVGAAGEALVPVVPYGGGTGLVCGQLMPDGPAPLIVSLERMDGIRALYPDEAVMIVEAGCILADIQAAARDAGAMFPLSLAAEGSARIGGNLSTNAGGVNVLRYGPARAQCLGLEAVLPDGRVWHGLSRLRKDNTGYDLRDLLIGAEGTLGIITAASLRLVSVPAVTGTAWFSVASPAAALRLLLLARARLGEAVSAFELIHRQGLEFLAQTLPEIRQPFATPPEWSVLADIGLAVGQDADAALGAIFERAMDAGLVSDGVIAQSQAQQAGLWAVREHLPEANKRIGSISSHDLSLPLGEVAAFIDRAGALVRAIGDFRINCFGHVGDGNLHFNVFPPAGRDRSDYDRVRDQIRRTLHDLVHEMGGSVSAEHGIGRLKVDELARYGDPVALSAMRGIKLALDPRGIMNPGAVLR
jgi:FAD/FMN-containing dehydrogenase